MVLQMKDGNVNLFHASFFFNISQGSAWENCFCIKNLAINQEFAPIYYQGGCANVPFIGTIQYFILVCCKTNICQNLVMYRYDPNIFPSFPSVCLSVC